MKQTANRVKRRLSFIGTVLAIALWPCCLRATETGVVFNRDIRPILSDSCYQCHGQDRLQRKAKLRLDKQEDAHADRGGYAAIVPGKPELSELYRRVTHPDLEERMPPAETGHALDPEQIDLLRCWIEAGGDYQRHWAFIPPKRAAPLAVVKSSWVRNPIDTFILAKLEARGLTPLQEADPTTLLRRVYLDLSGLPPTPEEARTFLNDHSKNAYERVVDRLLAGSRFGEHMAASWLDLARYADTNGYNNDTPRYNWRYRDWVIEAFNQNLSYRDFIIHQLAGDLLPDATIEQKIATGFNRNHNVTSEGGIIDEEYRLEYVADRVHTTATSLMALSLRCARCHEHKFDPISQKEYYQFFAFFNQVPEHGYHKEHVGNPKPVIPAPTHRQQIQLKQLEARSDEIQRQLNKRKQVAEETFADWEESLDPEAKISSPLPADPALYVPLDGSLEKGVVQGATEWTPGRVGRALAFDGKSHVDLNASITFNGGRSFSYGAWVYPSSRQAMNILSRMDVANGHRGVDLTYEGGPVSVHLIHQSPGSEIKAQTQDQIPLNRWTHVFATYDGSGKAAGVGLYFNGQAREVDIHHDSLKGSILTDKKLRIGRRSDSIPFVGRIDEVLIYERSLSDREVQSIADYNPTLAILSTPPQQRDSRQRQALLTWQLQTKDSEYRRLSDELSRSNSELEKLRQSLPTAMVMNDMASARPTFVLERGQYDKPKDRVSQGVPSMLPPFPEGAPPNRLGLAQWLTLPEHPLTTRVAVNRLWSLLFGLGIVETLEEFGSQGEWPTHPELLDWLAVEFVNLEWDVKALLRLMVTSATYRQASELRPELVEKDPDNRLWARGPRFRMTAEMIRDQALAISGLLEEGLGGPSVRPYQPPGLWVEVAVADDSYSGGPFRQDQGASLYRRSLYTWWKRTCPPPALDIFDAPNREFCTVRRSRTNTPLQALALLNDPTFVEASRKFAERVMRYGGQTAQSRIRFAFRVAVTRAPTAREAEVMEALLNGRLEAYSRNPAAAKLLLAVGDSAPDPRMNSSELAAWTILASVILNLDEVITKG